jgi:hypothetical protein
VLPADFIDAVQPAAGSDAHDALGLFRAADFRIADGVRPDEPGLRQALWYFAHETVALPEPGMPIATFAPDVAVGADLRDWIAHRGEPGALDFPPLVWIAAPGVLAHAQLSRDATTVAAAGQTMPLRLTPRFALNRSWFNDASAAFFSRREVKLRGRVENGSFVARTIWPEDFRFDRLADRCDLPAGATAASALRALIRAHPDGGARSPFAVSTLWRRHALEPDLTGRTVIGFVLNGAQGDDDEAHGGHLGLVTGRVAQDGAIGAWIVNNFYTLDSESEKAIIAAPVPLDNYLGDLNAGQNWYRPSCVLVAVLARPRAAVFAQSGLGRVYNQFYRHQLAYDHSTMNCAGITVDALRALGWNIPARGPTNRLLAWASLPFVALRERSLPKVLSAFDYLNEDQTRLLPAVALEEAFASLLALATGDERGNAGGALEHLLAEDVDALALLRFPQFPSSRAWGAAAAISIQEIHDRLPRDRTQLKIIPVPPRPFPSSLRDPDLLPAPFRPSEIAAYVWAALSIVGIPWVAWRLWRRHRRATVA